MILITGATGLVGSHLLLRLLEEGHSVRALYRNESKREAVRHLFAFYEKESLFFLADWHLADLNDMPSLEPAFEGVVEVYHCAAFISFLPQDEARLRKVNIEGTANIVNLCIAFGIRKLCHVSSIAALGDLREGETVNTEESEWNPEVHHSDYAISKYGAEMEVWRGIQEGVDAVVVNPGIIVGPLIDHHSGTATLFYNVQKGMRFYTEGTIAVVDVNDVVDAMRLLMASEVSGEKYILSGATYTYRKLATEVANALGVAPPSKRASKTVLSFVWRMDAVLAFLRIKRRAISRASAASLWDSTEISADKIKSEFGFRFRSVSDAIALAARYWLRG